MKYKYYACACLAVVLWGTLYVAGKVLLAGMPTMLLLFFRFASASVVLWPISEKVYGKSHIQREDYLQFLIVGILGYFLANAAQLLSIEYSNSSTASLLNSMNPIFIMIFARIFLKEKMNIKKVSSVIVAVIGAVIIIGVGALNGGTVGVTFSIISVLFWSYTTIYIKKLSLKYNPLFITSLGMGIAAVLSLPTAIAYMRVTEETVQWSNGMILNLIYVCIICTGLAHVLWNFALSKVDAGACAVFYPVQPMVSMIFGTILLDEIITTQFFVGSLFIISGILILVIPSKNLRNF